MVYAGEVITVPIVVIAEFEIIEAHPANQLNVTRQMQLVLHVTSRQLNAEMIVCVRCVRSKHDGCRRGWIRQRHEYRCRGVVEEAGVSEVLCFLLSNFSSCEDVVLYSSGTEGVSDVRLIEDVTAVTSVVVCSQRYLLLICRHRSRYVVLIEL